MKTTGINLNNLATITRKLRTLTFAFLQFISWQYRQQKPRL